ncbi:alpha-1,3-mannosyl-glycoprotein 4-beta-N-acetylglucosaminyltransferase A-like [Uloborus diversus]|uniref:alpha-1,3-mannosyl-glycoprotein 4-beta-N-acetylglucosaminyltransferase A-like n=1 Tax=Uloborus diversus TaxID=327109 RepID=UPI0024092384|nr:alpha-1,3-mannosyl-glycoprotein 4-beta-N-acetylglucosaminyltransferase A-like [Uloborus diversus]XP_054722813.1 alpha-1,3-mannosyl-glycoprotein 4-beta-N-acetylglucosaminyltransferase A-like [Uloborus diversus]
MMFRRPAFAFYIGVLIASVPFFTIFILLNGPDLSEEHVLSQRVLELYERLKHAEMLNLERRNDIVNLRRNFGALFKAASTIELLNNSVHLEKNNLWKDSQQLLAGIQGTVDLQLPSIHHFLPHLIKSPDSLTPSIKLSRDRSGVTMVLGIPTVKREVQSYLMSTLQNLIENMSLEEKNDAIIIVFIAEMDSEYIVRQAAEIENQFQEHINSGLLEVIAPPSSFYPDFDQLRQTLGDPPERVKWRTKQNLDFSFLMMYAQPKGMFYVQLEDDILSKPGYIESMKKFAYKQTAEKKDWMILDFCQLGFIGKMFKCIDLSKLITFFVIFHSDKPVDWLLDHVVQTKVCRFDKDPKDCKKRKDQVWLHYKPSLFQHVGTHSSLKGKVQKLKDKQFGKLSLHHPHKNPEADVKTSLKAYKGYSATRAYKGDTFFWSLLPQPGDILAFHFKSPIVIEKYLFRSGNAEHPEDKFVNTTVEVLPVYYSEEQPYTKTKDGFLIVGQFKDTTGVAEGNISSSVGQVKVMRLYVHAESDRWAILSEIHIQPVERKLGIFGR